MDPGRSKSRVTKEEWERDYPGVSLFEFLFMIFILCLILVVILRQQGLTYPIPMLTQFYFFFLKRTKAWCSFFCWTKAWCSK